MTEVWRPVVGFEGLYEVSDHGRVRSVERFVRGKAGVRSPRVSRVLALSANTHGYLHVSLSRENKRRTAYVHGLVLQAFVGPRPEGLEACHQDGDKTNNAIGNLRWDTRSQNALDRVRHGTHNYLASNRARRAQKEKAA